MATCVAPGCGHARAAHIYHAGACRPGFLCSCVAFREQPIEVHTPPNERLRDALLNIRSASESLRYAGPPQRGLHEQRIERAIAEVEDLL